MKVAVFATPKSGANRRRPRRLRALAEVAEAHGAVLHATHSLEELDRAVASLAHDRPDVLAINGGDGTVHRVLTAAVQVLDPLPTLAILPGGTMDIAARSTGWLGRGAEGLERVCAGGLRTTERSLLTVDGRWAGFLFGNGLIARFLEVYEEVPDPTAARAAQILARGAASAMVGGPFAEQLTRRWRGEVELDGEVLAGDDWLAVAAGTVEQIGLGFRPFRDARAGRMHAVALGSSVGRFARELPRVYGRRPLREPGNVERPATRLVLRSDEPASFMVDGDFHRGGQELVVEVGQTVTLLVP
ncbi:MAG: hypothetical protein KC656_01175 [Myxococcales bacterium]|nr:hypothetical protein [Myxococcales bacterium]